MYVYFKKKKERKESISVWGDISQWIQEVKMNPDGEERQKDQKGRKEERISNVEREMKGHPFQLFFSHSVC